MIDSAVCPPVDAWTDIDGNPSWLLQANRHVQNFADVYTKHKLCQHRGMAHVLRGPWSIVAVAKSDADYVSG